MYLVLLFLYVSVVFFVEKIEVIKCLENPYSSSQIKGSCMILMIWFCSIHDNNFLWILSKILEGHVKSTMIPRRASWLKRLLTVDEAKEICRDRSIWCSVLSDYHARGNKAKRGVEFRHSIRNVFRIQRKVRNASVFMGKEGLNTSFPNFLCLPCSVQREAKKFKLFVRPPRPVPL